jgi:general secretion pathway protein G
MVAIVAVLAGFGIPAYNRYHDNAKIAQAVADIRAIERDVYIYEGYSTTLPDDLKQVGKNLLLDPWGHPYQYYNAKTQKGNGQRRFDKLANPLNTDADFDLYSMGKDGNTAPGLDKNASNDDVVRAGNGRFVGLASAF